MIHLAKRKGLKPVLSKTIAAEERIPQKFLELILLELRDAGYLGSRPGKGGGYTLQRAPDAIHLGHVIRLIDGPLAPIQCVSQTAYKPCADCIDERTCVLRKVMKEVRDATAEILEQTTLQQLVEDEAKLKSAHFVVDFNI